MIMIISERCTIQCPIRLFQVKIQPIGKKWRCFLSGLNEYLMEIDELNENSSSEFLASHFAHHQFYFIFNSMHHGIWCGWNTERARASHTQKKTRNQRNWNVEQLNMQCNWIGFSSAFVYLLQIETHIRARKYHMHGELIGAWLRSFECARTSKRNRSNHFPSLWSPKAGRKSNVQFVFLYSSLLLLRHSNHKYFFCVCSGCIRFLCMSSAPKTGTISNMKSNVCSKNHHTKWWTFYEFQGKSGF